MRSEADYEDQIRELQARLHEATSQLDLANNTCVKQGAEIESLTEEKEEFKDKLRNLGSENSVLKRKIAAGEQDNLVKIPRPGPSLKPFESLTPRQQKIASDKLQKQVLKTSEERKILPRRLSAFLTYRLTWFS